METVQLLNEQLQTLTSLCQVLERENQHLLSKERNVQEMEQIIEEKTQLQQQLADIEDKRVQVMGTTTLAEFAKDHEVGDLVNQYHQTLAKIKELVETNQLLIGLGVQYYEGVLNTISDSTKEKVNTYGQGGKMYQSEIQKTSLINKKI